MKWIMAMTKTTVEQAEQLVVRAIEKLPELNPCGNGVPQKYYLLGKDVAGAEIRERQAGLFTEQSLMATAACVDWLNSHPKGIRSSQDSYEAKHRVENWRADNGEDFSYVSNGAFIAAGVGMGLRFKAGRPNVVFYRSR